MQSCSLNQLTDKQQKNDIAECLTPELQPVNAEERASYICWNAAEGYQHGSSQ